MRPALPIASVLALFAMPVLAGSARDTRHDGDRMICRSTFVTGTRVATQRVCLSLRQWRELHEENLRKMNEINDYVAKNTNPRG